MTFEIAIEKLKAIGFVQIAETGSHVMLKHPNYAQRITLPVLSSGKKLSPGTFITIQKIIVEAGIATKEEFQNDN